MSDDEGLFDGFDVEDDDGDVQMIAEVQSNPMKRAEDERREDARRQANKLLEDIMSGNLESAEPAYKRKRVDEEPVELLPPPVFDRTCIVHTLKTQNENCTHEVAVPPGIEYHGLPKKPAKPAKTYPFTLDPFQNEAIACIENDQSVLVSAHTSAGKTVVALYAIAQCLKNNQRVIYTSPIKALSNQKYRELAEEFEDVGLLTGDVTLNKDASVLVMTTEILRSMLYRGAELLKEIGWVIFDEIHYMRDKERGVVWEETIILMPHEVHHVFLSATIPNARQFAQWVCWLHNQPCHVVYTDYRPTPLQHFIFPAGGDGLYEVVNMKGEFREDKFNQAMSGLATAGDQGAQRGRKGGAKPDSNVVKIIRTIKERDMLPCIIFSFSRKECEAYATSLKEMDFNDANEKKCVDEIYRNAIDLLSDNDRKLPQIGEILPLLKRGIGVHHSGLLPILKETIEILFGEGLIKTLFATETFSMGLNMPARTVLFTSARKYDGKNHRWITSGEYIQMSGRAGRRGKDDRGLVILMMDSKMSSDDAKHIIKGETDPLNSQFRLTYNMVLNLIRVEGIAPEFMLERSFYQFQNMGLIPSLNEKINQKTEQLAKWQVEEESNLTALFDMKKQMDIHELTIKKIVRQPVHVVPFLQSGRMICIKAGTREFGWGVVVNYKRKINPDDASQHLYIIEVFIPVSPSSLTETNAQNSNALKPPENGEKPAWEVIPMTVECIDKISVVRVKMPQDISTNSGKHVLANIIKATLDRFKSEIPLLDPVKDMKIRDEALVNEVNKKNQMERRWEEHDMRKRRDFEKLKNEWEAKNALRQEIESLSDQRRRAQSILQMDELAQRKRVLKRLQYCTQDETIEAKGRVACELSASDEILLTEMLYGGVFNNMNPAEIGALLSCFVFQENAQTRMDDTTSGFLRTLHDYARRIAKISIECKLESMNEETYVEQFKPGLMMVVMRWVHGEPFSEIIKSTDVFEGSIIRTLRRLEEVLREMISAAKAMDNDELQKKFEECRTKLKRDIVFAASLYL
ncbi:hypothetical protein WR25_19969 [Diploscapter pachys]|uniref:Helicase ATP-binding domain-containing protein n=1 Tax=Diploscapter pachys TaxID=2018661 RepID=A0A2A2KVM4_9BILA|nr:hypothetical protein WR25_19969 [Diploscapter pachys]